MTERIKNMWKAQRLKSDCLIGDIKKLCLAVGTSVDLIAKKYNVNQDMVLDLFVQTIKQVQEKVKG